MTLAMELKMMRKEGHQEGLQQGLQQGLLQGEKRKAVIIAQNLLSMGISKEDIMEATGLSEEELNTIIASFS